MTLEDAFLQAILETPDDDLPRLAYADWFEERGDPRGEFIHVQCRLDRMDAEDDLRFELEEREDELLRRHQDEWLGTLRPLLRYWTFARGFLDTIRVPVSVYLAEGEIARPGTVRRLEVDLTGFEVPWPVREFMPESVARENVLLPLTFDSTSCILAMNDPNDKLSIHKLECFFGRKVKGVAASREQLVVAINRLYNPAMFGGLLDSISTDFMWDFIVRREEEGPDDTALAAQVVRLLMAVAVRGAEIRLEFGRGGVRVRYAVGNDSIERDNVPIRLADGVLARIKILAGIASEEEGDQPGHIHWTADRGQFNIEVVLRIEKDMKTVLLRSDPFGTEWFA